MLALSSHALESPLFWAVFVGWVMSVVLHEFAHGVVAYFGGDYTIKERGGLTLNPLQYLYPVNSIILPAIFLLMGGLPLPGGATYVRRDLLRSKTWDCLVSLAGPAMNFLLVLVCLLPLHPTIGWMHPEPLDVIDGAPAVLATLAWLQFLVIVLNLIPLPPLDGFGAISAFMPPHHRETLYQPQVVLVSLIILFAVISSSHGFINHTSNAFYKLLGTLGFGDETMIYIDRAMRAVLTGQG